MRISRIVGLFVLLSCCGGQRRADQDVDGPTPQEDDDLDSILNGDEGCDAGTDTDGDTVPDYQDPDSDGDTIPDVVEAGDADTETPPVDSDGDGSPDFRDLDSDANGVLDMDEGARDTDSDGVGDFADPDNDGDAMDDVDEIDDPSAPTDADGDTVPDYKDLDSDDDTILDEHERPAGSDVDGDWVPDRRDLDSDGDGIDDEVEAGDTDVHTPPRDTDGDLLADFRDLDSDDDGLSDSWELGHGTNPYDGDTDGDGVPDGVEVSFGSDPLDAADSPRTSGGLFFVMRYNDPEAPPVDPDLPEPEVDHLVYRRIGPQADVFLTVGMGHDLGDVVDSLRSSLTSVIVPGAEAVFSNPWFGVGRFDGCRGCPYSMAVLQPLTSEEASVESALAGWTFCGGASPYSQDLVVLATGDISRYLPWGGISPTSWTCTPPGAIGWPCFRTGSLPVVVQFGYEPWSESLSECSPAPDHADAIAALGSIGARYIGVNTSAELWYSSRSDMMIVATGSGSVDSEGAPLVFDVPPTGVGLGTTIVDALSLLAGGLETEDYSVSLRDDPSDEVDAIAEFVDFIEPSLVGGHPDPSDPTRVCETGLHVADRLPPLDGSPDSFVGISVGTVMCFDLHVKTNWTVPSEDEPRIFGSSIEILAGGLTVVDTRPVLFLVPPTIVEGP